jgi:hypothetical protein
LPACKQNSYNRAVALAVGVASEVRRWRNPSDHAPLWVVIDDARSGLR